MKIKLSDTQIANMKTYLIDRIQSLRAGIQTSEKNTSISSDVRAILDLTLREILDHFGTKQQFKDWIKSIRDIEAIHLLQVDTAIKEGFWVSKDLVMRGVVEPFTTAHIRMLTDGSKTLARRIAAMTSAGRDIKECEVFAEECIKGFIQTAKKRALEALGCNE